MHAEEPQSVTTALLALLEQEIAGAGGWIGFDRFMAIALYAPGLGYYARASRPFGRMPASGSDFVTAPELSPLFGRALARQVAQALDAGAGDELWEFGAGSGALAAQLLDSLGDRVRRYSIVEVSAGLAASQRERLAAFGDRVRWLQAWPDTMSGVVLGNEVLDAMPVQLLHWDGTHWLERGVSVADGVLTFADRPTGLTPPVEGAYVAGTVCEIHRQAEAFVRTLAGRLERGMLLLLDYGFPQAEYYHPQRIGGTLMCHRAHRADTDPLADVGCKDITAHVDFTGIALAAQDAGLEVLGYTSQARFLINCGLAQELERAQARGDLRAVSDGHKLLAEHEMGELFKVIGLAKGLCLDAMGFSTGDRSHRL